MISLSENILENGNSLINQIKEDDLIRKTSTFKEHEYEINGKRYYYCYAVDMDSFVYDFQIRKLKTYVTALNEDFKEYDIMYSSALCPQDGDDVKILFERLNAFSKGDIDEEDTNS